MGEAWERLIQSIFIEFACAGSEPEPLDDEDDDGHEAEEGPEEEDGQEVANLEVLDDVRT